jgi:alkanesulfonate monooxygenase SsuD/methylene tetrahydromethanopterin reductase-like flavin-dependent oxidoreductase (luciferase family)
MAREAEDAGWDGYFLWDHILFTMFGNAPMGDPWVSLAAMAMATSRIKLGTLVTPLPRRHIGKLARETATLDLMSEGRLVLGVGIGHDRNGREYSAFGENADDRTRGEMLDEGLEVLTGLWSGKPFSFEGKHYRVDDVEFLPRPVQEPRIPIWVAGTWPHKKPFRRAAQWDGVASQAERGGLKPTDYRDIVRYIRQYRESDAPFDVIRPSPLPAGEAHRIAETIGEYEEAGVTWWMVPFEDDMGTLDELHSFVRKGPPRR